MATYKNYGTGAAQNSYEWTGVNTLNQVASLIDLPEDIYATAISVYWGGNGASAVGRHAIWSAAGSGNLIVASGNITVGSGSSSGQGWNTANIAETLIPAGRYFIGFWCDPGDPRIWRQWTTGQVNSLTYRKTVTGSITNMGSNATDGSGILAGYITGEPGGRAWVKDAGSWKKGVAWVKDGGVWKKAQAVWVKDAGVWKRAK